MSEQIEGRFHATVKLFGDDLPVTVEYTGHVNENSMDYDRIDVMACWIDGDTAPWAHMADVKKHEVQIADDITPDEFDKIEKLVQADMRQQYER